MKGVTTTKLVFSVTELALRARALSGLEANAQPEVFLYWECSSTAFLA